MVPGSAMRAVTTPAEGRGEARVAEHGAGAAACASACFGLRARCVELRLGGLGAPRDLVHLLRTHALFRLQLLVARERAGGEVGVALRGAAC